jgi:hypothetical protein
MPRLQHRTPLVHNFNAIVVNDKDKTILKKKPQIKSKPKPSKNDSQTPKKVRLVASNAVRPKAKKTIIKSNISGGVIPNNKQYNKLHNKSHKMYSKIISSDENIVTNSFYELEDDINGKCTCGECMK